MCEAGGAITAGFTDAPSAASHSREGRSKAPFPEPADPSRGHGLRDHGLGGHGSGCSRVSGRVGERMREGYFCYSYSGPMSEARGSDGLKGSASTGRGGQ